MNLKQILKTLHLLGPARAIRMKKHHEQGLAYVRGYAATSCWWTLLKLGFLDDLQKQGQLSIPDYAAQKNWNLHTLAAVTEYLHGIGLLEIQKEQVSLTTQGKILLAEPRGLIELLGAYEPCFQNLPDTLLGKTQYGKDFTRDVTYVGIGSGRLCQQLPYPVMRKMILDQNCQRVLDLGCGDLALLEGLCQQNPQIHCHGIDFSNDMIQFNQKKLTKQNYNNRLTTQQADMFNLPENLPPIDCVTACDTFHEYLHLPEQIVNLLQSLRTRFPNAAFVIGEFCLQNPIWLHRHKTASLEHHLFHQLTNQHIGSAQQWRDLFKQAGLTIQQENVFDLIGHGYFLLR